MVQRFVTLQARPYMAFLRRLPATKNFPQRILCTSPRHAGRFPASAIMGLMKPDLYTKAALTVIAIALTVMAANQYVSPSATAHAQSVFADIQAVSVSNFFDRRTGDLWEYELEGTNRKVYAHLRMTKPGGTLTLICETPAACAGK